MELTALQVFEVTPVVTRLINENRPMPLKGKYRLGRWHAKLKPEFDAINERRDELIKSYDNPVMNEITDPDTGTVMRVRIEGRFVVPDEKLPEFNATWASLCEEKVDFPGMQPMPLAQLDVGDDTGAAISAIELMTLGELVAAE